MAIKTTGSISSESLERGAAVRTSIVMNVGKQTYYLCMAQTSSPMERIISVTTLQVDIRVGFNKTAHYLQMAVT